MSDKFTVKYVKTEGWCVVLNGQVMAVEATKVEAEQHAQVLNNPSQQVPPRGGK